MIKPFTETQNFTREEIGADLHPFLLMSLQYIRTFVNKPIVITRTIATFEEHADVYKKMHRDKWHEKITLGTAHQAQILKDGTISQYAHAVDWVFSGEVFDKYLDEVEISKKLEKMITNPIIGQMFPREVVSFGLGVGKHKFHLDCAVWRGRIHRWYYR